MNCKIPALHFSFWNYLCHLHALIRDLKVLTSHYLKLLVT